MPHRIPAAFVRSLKYWLSFLAVTALFACALCRAGESAVVIIYQPIFMESDATTVETPKGFMIMPIPFLCHSFHGFAPYYAITQPNQILTDAPRSVLSDDMNLLSSAGVLIAGSFEDATVYVHFENLKHPGLAGENVTDDDIAEATLECVRRRAHDDKKRPKLIITGRKGDEAKWAKWLKRFQEQDLEKPFTRP